MGYLGESNYLNLFAYCGNNPVMFTDPTGKYIAINYDRIWPETIFRLDYHQFDTWLRKISNHIYNKESSGFWAFLGLIASYIDCAVVQVGLFAVDAVTNIVTGYYDELESVRHHGDNLRYDSKTRYDNYSCFHYDLNFYISFLDGYHGWEIKMSSYIGRMHLQTYIFNIRWGGAYLDMLEFMLEIKECDATLYYDMRFSYFMEKRL